MLYRRELFWQIVFYEICKMLGAILINNSNVKRIWNT